MITAEEQAALNELDAAESASHAGYEAELDPSKMVLDMKRRSSTRGNSGGKARSVNQMQGDVDTGHAPKSIKRVDKGNPDHGELDNVHFVDDKHCLYRNGKWKHFGRPLTNDEKNWLTENGWTLPEEKAK